MFKMVADQLARLGFTSERQPGAPVRPAPAEAAMIVGGPAAPELCMKPVDWSEDQQPHARAIVQLKVDGIRALRIDDRIVSMEGVPLDCASQCLGGLKRIEQHMGEPMMFDGEYTEEDGFNATISAMRKGVGQGTLWLFDAVPLREWRTDTCSQPIEQRLERLAHALPHAESAFVGMLDYWVMSPAETVAKAQELIGLGYEGVVSKRARSMYARRRSDDWRRLKSVVTVDCVVMDVVQRPGGNHALIVRDPAGQTIKVPLHRGDGDAAALLTPGSIVEIAYNPIVGGGTRGVRFIRARADKETAR